MTRTHSRSQKQPPDEEPTAASPEPGCLIVVGASAGGFQALRALVSALPYDLQASLVVAQHLPPVRESNLAQILQLATRLRVKVVVDGQFPERGTIHVVPPGTDVLIEDGRLWLVAAPRRISPQPSIDRLLHSLAAEPRFDCRIGIILSGLGNDGADGIRALQRLGGICLAQLPSQAHAPDMPEAALETGCVDHAAEAEQLGARLQGLASAPVGDEGWTEARLSALDVACRQWEAFGSYRFDPELVAASAGLRRRLRAIADPDAYIETVRSDPAEALGLLRSLLRPLGTFGRIGIDRERLLTEVVGRYREWAGPRPFRVWSVGCALGEEPYQIAMELETARAHYSLPADFLVYGTDLLADAVSAARVGTYEPVELAGLSTAQRQEFFEPRLRHAQLRPDLRRKVLFTVHDALRDVPLPGIQFIACFGVLGRLRAPLAETLAQRLRDSLAAGGRLLTD